MAAVVAAGAGQEAKEVPDARLLWFAVSAVCLGFCLCSPLKQGSFLLITAAFVLWHAQHLGLDDSFLFLYGRTYSVQQEAWTPLIIQDLPLVVGEFLLHQEQVGFELVPLRQHLSDLLLGETGSVGILQVYHQLVSQVHFGLTRIGLLGWRKHRYTITIYLM